MSSRTIKSTKKSGYGKKIDDQLEANKKNAYGYTRVSDESQIDRHSLMTQLQQIISYCKNNDLQLLRTFTDEGKSGRSINGRDDFLELMKIIQPGNFIIVYEVSRFSRNLGDIMQHFENLVKKKGCTFICLNPFIDSRVKGAELNVMVNGLFAHNESSTTSDRVHNNMSRLHNEGKLMSRPPFGYIHDPVTRQFLPEKEQQDIVREIELLYLGGLTINKIISNLNERGFGDILNNNKKTKILNPKFSYWTVGNILRGYGILKDDKSPQFTYPQRIEKWNEMFHECKLERKDKAEPEFPTVTELD